MKRVPIRVGGAEVMVHMRGPRDSVMDGVPNWSLQSLTEATQLESRAANISPLYNALLFAETRDCFAPHSVGNARVIEKEMLSSTLRFGERASLYRNADLPADGLFIDIGDGFAISFDGGGALIIAEGDGLLFVGSGSRDALIDRGAVEGEPTRPHMSIVGAMMEAFAKRDVPPEKVTATLHFSTPQEQFEHRLDHPKHGEFNRKLQLMVEALWPGSAPMLDRNRMFLSLASVFAHQVRVFSAKMIRTEHAMNEFPEFAHARDEEAPPYENLYIVKRLS